MSRYVCPETGEPSGCGAEYGPEHLDEEGWIDCTVCGLAFSPALLEDEEPEPTLADIDDQEMDLRRRERNDDEDRE